MGVRTAETITGMRDLSVMFGNQDKSLQGKIIGELLSTDRWQFKKPGSLSLDRTRKAAARIEQMPRFYAGYLSVPDMGDYRKLDVWKKAHALSVRVYQIAANIRSARHRPLRNQ